MPGFAQLPPEIVRIIALCFGRFCDIASLAASGRRFFAVVDHVLYLRVAKSPQKQALFWAAVHGRLDTLRKVLAAGADPNYMWNFENNMAPPGALGPLNNLTMPARAMGGPRFRVRPSRISPFTFLEADDHASRGLPRAPVMYDVDDPTMLTTDDDERRRRFGQCTCWFPEPGQCECSALHMAVRHGHDEIVTALLDAGAEIDAPSRGFSAALGDTALLDELLQKHSDKLAVDCLDDKRQPPITYAYAYSRWEAVEWLLDHGAKLDSEEDSDMGSQLCTSTLLEDALVTARFRDARRLLNFGARIAECDKLQMARYCCRSYSVDRFETSMFTAHYQDQDNVQLRIELLLELLPVDRSWDVDPNSDALSPLAIAVIAGKIELVKFLLERFPGLDHPMHRSIRPILHDACVCRVTAPTMEMMSLLVDRGAMSFCDDASRPGVLAVVAAHDSDRVPGKLALVNLLLAAGAAATPEQKYAAAGAAVSAYDGELLGTLLEKWQGQIFTMEQARHLLEMLICRPRPRLRSNPKFTERFTRCLALLLDFAEHTCGPAIKKSGILSDLIKHRGIELATVELFLARYGGIEHADMEGMTALHYAVTRSRTDIATLLLQKGADPQKNNVRGDSPFGLVIRASHDPDEAKPPGGLLRAFLNHGVRFGIAECFLLEQADGCKQPEVLSVILEYHPPASWHAEDLQEAMYDMVRKWRPDLLRVMLAAVAATTDKTLLDAPSRNSLLHVFLESARTKVERTPERTPHRAADINRAWRGTETLVLLLEHGAEISSLDGSGLSGVGKIYALMYPVLQEYPGAPPSPARGLPGEKFGLCLSIALQIRIDLERTEDAGLVQARVKTEAEDLNRAGVTAYLQHVSGLPPRPL
ncbi:ankyrin repeat-containing domain protein [Microdochium bolleyi]|uniref:Ankyrin repeat-containing domain protein n=1 Tax=Microdochium bolleyi TaxID=196109 RepID=A0A136IYT2_9PEZI|nr:ankyrin repeat-containing domain protein [Microdochium bolleyi]